MWSLTHHPLHASSSDWWVFRLIQWLKLTTCVALANSTSIGNISPVLTRKSNTVAYHQLSITIVFTLAQFVPMIRNRLTSLHWQSDDRVKFLSSLLRSLVIAASPMRVGKKIETNTGTDATIVDNGVRCDCVKLVSRRPFGPR